MKYKVGDEIYLIPFFSSYLSNKGVIKYVSYSDLEQMYYYSMEFNGIETRRVKHEFIDHEKSLKLKREKILKLL